MSLEPVEGFFEARQILLGLLNECGEDRVVLTGNGLFEPFDVECDYCLCLFAGADSGLELCRHSVQEICFRRQVVVLTEGRSDGQVAFTDLSVELLESIEGAGDAMYCPQGVQAMDGQYRQGPKGPRPVSGVQIEQVGCDNGSLLPGERRIVESLHEGPEHGNGQQQRDQHRIRERQDEYARLKRMHEGQPSSLCARVLWPWVVMARGRVSR